MPLPFIDPAELEKAELGNDGDEPLELPDASVGKDKDELDDVVDPEMLGLCVPRLMVAPPSSGIVVPGFFASWLMVRPRMLR